MPQSLWGWRGIFFVHEIRKAEQLSRLIVQRDIKVTGIHQFADNSVNCCVELLQIFGRAGLFRDAVERGAQRFGTLLFRYVAIKNINRDLLSADDDWRSGQENVHQRAILALPLGLQLYSLALIQALCQPLGLRRAIGGNDKLLNAASHGLLSKIAEHAR